MSRRKSTFEKSLDLLLDITPALLAVAVPLIEMKIKAALTPPAPPPAGRVKWYVLAALACYAAFIALTVCFVKLAWRWVL